ncbi:MAG: AraC family transcriptional regulator ligand-binding domain-containing protein [Polyangiales bacterium]
MADAATLQGTYSSALGKGMLAFAVAHGFTADAILERMQVAREQLEDPDARLPVGPALGFWEHVVRSLDEPAVPIRFARALSASDFGVLGFAAMTAPNAAAGLARVARYYAVLADTARLQLIEDAAVVRVELVRPGERSLGLRIMNENTIACLLQAVRSVTRTQVTPLQVAFRHAAPARLAAHADFFGCSLDFDAPWEGLVLPAGALAVAPAWRDAQMDNFFVRHASELYRRLQGDGTTTDRVRAAIEQLLSDGEPAPATVAKRMGVSERTLRRQLQHEGVTLRALVDDTRRELAVRLLVQATVNITEIAYLLGFSEPSAFTRAFKRWHGCSPREYRAAPFDAAHAVFGRPD